MGSDQNTIVLAILVSRVEALCTASMLEANGIAVHLGGSAHASVEVNSLALGGHRLRIAAADHQAASDLIREVGSAESWEFSYGLRRAILKLMALWAAIFVAPFSISSFLETRNPIDIVLPLTSLLGLPVNPQGRGDYFLTFETG